MKIICRLFIGTMFLFQIAYGQKAVTVQGLVNTSFYTTLDSAIAHAADGDQIYLPGGVFTSNLSINKSVMIFGTGHYPDSTIATGITMLTGNVSLVTGASGGLITGCNIGGDIIVGSASSGDSVSNYTITRCVFKNLLLSYNNGLPPTNARNFSIYENVIKGSILGANAQNINVTKNIIEGFVGNFNGNCSFVNNDFIGLGNCTTMLTFVTDVSACTFENNVILFSPPACAGAAFFGGTCNNNVFSSDLFLYAMTFPQGTNTGFNTINNQPVASTFVTATGDVFFYSQDYHLKVTSPGFHAATDGYDIGVYGTSQPYKNGAVPFNPHIQLKSVNTSTNPQGQLNIQIRAAAQDY